MNKIEWKVGEIYEVDDIMSSNDSILEGFIINQCPINWEDKSTYRNHASNDRWFVLSFFSNFLKSKRYVLAKPYLSSSIYDCMNGSTPSSEIRLQGTEYADSPESLIKQLRENWVFTTELSYDAKYKEGFGRSDLSK